MKVEKFPKVGIIILNYNSWQDTVRCLESLQQIDYSDYQIIVVDNNSTDESIERIKEWAEGKLKVGSKYVKYRADLKPVFYVEYDKETAENGGIEEYEKKLDKYPSNRKLVIIQTGKNLGFSAGNNVGIKYAIKRKAKAVFLLNPDIVLQQKDSLKEMMKVCFDKEDVYIVGPKVVDKNGLDQSPLRQPKFLEEVFRLLISPFVKINYVIKIENGEFPVEVERVVGCCMLLKTDFLEKIGLLDEGVFLYGEEAILSAQVKRLNGKILFVPYVKVHHLHNKPSKKLFKFFIRSRKYYLQKYTNYNKLQITILLTLYTIIFYALKVSEALKKVRFKIKKI